MNTFNLPFNGNSLKELLSAFDKGAYYPIQNPKLQNIMPLMIRKTPGNRSTAEQIALKLD
jgi:hypothetical protein